MTKVIPSATYGALIASVFLLAGCIATPQPNPPNIVVEIEPDAVFTDITNRGGIDLFGHPGAIEPPEATLRVYNLDNDAPPVDETVDDDGSFHVEIDGENGNAFRLQAILDEARSEAFDVIVEIGGVYPMPKPLALCLSTEPQTWIEVPTGVLTNIEVTNDCDEVIVVSDTAFRFDPTNFVIRDAPPNIPARSSATIALEYVPGAAASEDILMIELMPSLMNETDRRPITLVGVDP